jgi:hypothetical protein
VAHARHPGALTPPALFQTLLVTLDSISELRVDPAFRVAATQVDDSELVVLVYHELVCFAVALEDFMLVQRINIFLALHAPGLSLLLRYIGFRDSSLAIS